MPYTLIFDPSQDSMVSEKILPLVKDIIDESIPFSDHVLDNISAEKELLVYLTDDQIKLLLSTIVEKRMIVAPLPHPEAKRFCAIAGIENNLEKAITTLKKSESSIEADLLYSNGRPVFSSVVIGSSFQAATQKYFKTEGVIKRSGRFIKRFFQLHPFRIDIVQKNDNVLKTAVSGIVVSTHKTYSRLSLFIPGESYYNDGMMNALLVSPRSVLELIRYGIRSLWSNNKLPEFGAHIKTDKLKFTSPKGDLMFSEDGENKASEELNLEVKNKSIILVPGANLKDIKEAPDAKETYKIQSLPTGDTAIALALGRLPFIKNAGTEEFKDLFEVLRENARLKGTYMVLMVLSTILATLGLFGNSSPVVIGAMILAPLMSPVISMSMATLRQDHKLMIDSFYTILGGLALSLAFAVILTWLTPIRMANDEIISRTSPNLLDLGIAIISGVAGAYAHARKEVAKTLAGVAIAVALVPPLAVAGIGLGWLDWSIFKGATLLLFTNLAGMILAGAVTFLVLGFSPFKLARKGVLISLIVVIIFCIPLFLGFNRMLLEHRIVRSIDGWTTENVEIKDVRVQSINPLNLSLKFVSPSRLEDNEIERIKNNIEERLQKEVNLEIVFSMHR